jgi:hypothetical protein
LKQLFLICLLARNDLKWPAFTGRDLRLHGALPVIQAAGRQNDCVNNR